MVRKIKIMRRSTIMIMRRLYRLSHYALKMSPFLIFAFSPPANGMFLLAEIRSLSYYCQNDYNYTAFKIN
jgi:hypothetical protein